MLTAGAIIEGARDRHPDFDPRRHPDATVLRHLTGVCRRLVAKTVRANRLALAVEDTVSIPDANGWDAGIPLPAHQQLHAVNAVSSGTSGDNPERRPIPLVPFAARFGEWKARIFAWTVGDRLYLSGAPSHWTGLASLVVTYTPDVPELEQLADVLPLPDEASEALTEALALLLTQRLPTADAAIRLPMQQTTADRAESAFLDGLAFRRARKFITRAG